MGLDEDIKRVFWEDLDTVIESIPQNEEIFVGGDFNGHIGRKGDGYEKVHGGFGYGDRNNGGVSILNFAVAYELSVVNSYFRKKEEHLVTFKSGNTRIQIDYFLVRANSRRLCKDCKLIPSECLATQHRLLAMDVAIRSSIRRKRRVRVSKVKWWNLTIENATKLAEKIKMEGKWIVEGDANKM